MKILFATDDVLEVPYDSLAGVNLDKVCLHRAILENMDLHATSFVGCDLRGAFLADSNLSRCNLSEASLITSYLMRANLKGAVMRNCRAMFCNFTGASLDEVDVQNADFSNCNLCGAVMTCINISSAKFTNAVYDNLTIWPSKFDPKEFGCIKNNA